MKVLIHTLIASQVLVFELLTLLGGVQHVQSQTF